MAKLSRTALKGIVKECLIEILNEGISGEAQDGGIQLNESKSLSGRGRSSQARSLSRTSSRLPPDLVNLGNSDHPKAPNKNFEKNIAILQVILSYHLFFRILQGQHSRNKGLLV